MRRGPSTAGASMPAAAQLWLQDEAQVGSAGGPAGVASGWDGLLSPAALAARALFLFSWRSWRMRAAPTAMVSPAPPSAAKSRAMATGRVPLAPKKWMVTRSRFSRMKTASTPSTTTPAPSETHTEAVLVLGTPLMPAGDPGCRPREGLFCATGTRGLAECSWRPSVALIVSPPALAALAFLASSPTVANGVINSDHATLLLAEF